MGMGGGGSSQPANTTTTTTQQLPAYVQPYSEQALQKGVDLSNKPYQAYGGQQIAGLTAEHQAALGGITNRAVNGSPLINATSRNLTDTANGAYLSPDSNPYLKGTYDKASEAVQASLSPKFGHMQAFGQSSGYNEALARANADIASNIYGGNYQQERTRQVQAAGLAPQIAGQDYADMQALLGVGDVRRQFSQDELNLAYQTWLQQQQYPYQQLDVLSNAIRGATGGGTTSQTAPNPYQPSPTAAMLGGGLAGAGIGSMINGSTGAGYGAAAGSVFPWIFK